MPKLKTHEEFMVDLQKNNTSYKNGEFQVVGKYRNKKSKILLKNKYGYANVIANNLLRNSTLCLRSALHQNEYLKEMFREVHGYRYSYKLVDFKDAHKKLEIRCHKHGIFLKNSNTHLLGEGCPKCKSKELLYKNRCNPTGWNHDSWVKNSKKSNFFDSFKFYIVKLHNEQECFIKIGRTHNTIKKRMNPIPYNHNLICYTNLTPDKAIELENAIKVCLKDYKYTPLTIFDGMHECFNIKYFNTISDKFIELTKGNEVFSLEPKATKGNSKLILDTSVGIFYESLIEACNALNLKYKYTSSSLSPTNTRTNKTSLIYV